MNDILKNSTSATSAFFFRQLREPLVVGLIVGVGTSAHSTPVEAAIQALRPPPQQTTSGASLELRHPAAKSISELRRLTGFTWEQLARLFNVSRRSLHFWASGARMAAANEEHLERVLATVRVIDRGVSAINRTALLTSQPDGAIPFEELANGRYDTVISLLGRGSPREPVRRLAMSREAKEARRPPPPEERVGALHDRVHQEGPGRPARKSVRMESGD